MSHCRFTLFFTRPAYRRGRYALVLVMPARPHNAISGILAGRILGFGIATFLLWHHSAHPVMFLVFFLLFPTDGLLGTWHISCLVTPLFTAACYDASIPLNFSWWLVFVFSCLLVFCGLCVFFVVCFVVGVGWSSSVFQWNNIIRLWHYEHRKLTTVSASLAVISTASKHLHNDLAKAIEALEQKKDCSIALQQCPKLLPQKVATSVPRPSGT